MGKSSRPRIMSGPRSWIEAVPAVPSSTNISNKWQADGSTFRALIASVWNGLRAAWSADGIFEPSAVSVLTD